MCALHDDQSPGVDSLEASVLVEVADAAIETDVCVESEVSCMDCEVRGSD